MLEKNLAFRDLERFTGLARGSIHNLLSGVSKSARGRQLLTNSIGIELWPGIPVVHEARFCLANGDFVIFSNRAMAREFAEELGDASEQSGCYVRIRRPLRLICGESKAKVDHQQQPDDGAERTRAASIEFWCGEEPPGSPWRLRLRQEGVV
jgi:hypothetical protein